MANEFRDMTKAAKKRMRQRMERNMKVAVEVLAGISRNGYVPTKTNLLRDSIEGKATGLSGTIGTPVEYAPYVEFGTGGRGESTKKTGFAAILERSSKIKSGKGGQKAQPFLRPLLDMHQDDFRRIMAK